MTFNWLGTTAIALIIGTGVVVAQSQPDTKREESPRAQASPSSKDADRPAAGERMKDRTAQPEPKAGAKDRGEADRKQAQEPRDMKQPRQSQDQPKGRDTKQGEAPTDRKQAQEPPRDTKQPTKQSDDQKGRDTKQDTKQSAEPKQQPKDSQARDTKQPADTKQQSQQQPGQQPRRERDQATQPSATPSTQQGARPGDTQQQGRTTSQTQESRTSVNEQQRTQIADQLRRDRTATTNVNVQVNIGERLPPRVRPRPLPPDIVRIVPQYRGYQFIVVEDEVVIVHPRTREIVEVFREPASSARTTSRSERVIITREQRETLRQSARRMTSAPTSGSSSASMDSCFTLQPVPEELVRANPDLGSYRYLAIGDHVVLVDPRQQKIVEVIQD